MSLVTISDDPLGDFVWREILHVHLQILYGERSYMCTYTFCMERDLTCAPTNFVWREILHVHLQILYGERSYMCTYKFCMERDLTCAPTNSM